MRYAELRKIRRLFFGHEEIARQLRVSLNSAKVTAYRYVKQGLLVRVKRNLYVLSERWLTFGKNEVFAIANLIQVPSYISLMTALDYYQITTQIQQNFIESISITRTIQTEVKPFLFTYTKIQKKLYFGFARKEGIFIAEPEKAYLDAVYLMSCGRYNLDLASIDYEKMDRKKIERLSRRFPTKTRSLLVKNEHF